MKILSALFCLFFVSLAFAGDMDKQRFIEKYKKYNVYVDNLKWEKAASEAEDLVRLSEKLFGKENKNTAAMVYNYGRSLLKNKDYKKSKKQLATAVKSYKKLYGPQSEEIIDPLMDLGKTESYLEGGEGCDEGSSFSEAIAVAKTNKLPELLVAELNQEAGVACLSASPERSKEFLIGSHNVFSSKFSNDDLRVVLSNYYLGKVFDSLVQAEKAKKHLLSVREALMEAPDSLRKYKLSANQLLIKINEENGDREASNHLCKEIGIISPWTEYGEAKPIFGVSPKYPSRAINYGREGFVTVKFLVDKNGYAKSPEVSDWKGDKAFQASALEAINKWRFVPKIKNGESVDSAYTEYKFVFDLPGDAGKSKGAGSGRKSSFSPEDFEDGRSQIPHLF